ncbi:MAG: hypothetical protein IJ545_04855 [Alphaproteobacteria bacterium]|nr:hypothetical protein [Alphaproteobacteria bacterium]
MNISIYIAIIGISIIFSSLFLIKLYENHIDHRRNEIANRKYPYFELKPEDISTTELPFKNSHELDAIRYAVQPHNVIAFPHHDEPKTGVFNLGADGLMHDVTDIHDSINTLLHNAIDIMQQNNVSDFEASLDCFDKHYHAKLTEIQEAR